MEDKLSAAIIQIDELHFLALEERLKLIEIKAPLDRLPILELCGQTRGFNSQIKNKISDRPWIERTEGTSVIDKYKYNILNPLHKKWDLQKESHALRSDGFITAPIKELVMQIDIYPDKKDIYRMLFRRIPLPNPSETRNHILKTIEFYEKYYNLYSPQKIGDEERIKRWMGRLYCLQLVNIYKGTKTKSIGSWKKAFEVTEKYLNISTSLPYVRDFFSKLQFLTGHIILFTSKVYDKTQKGWMLDGFINPPKLTKGS